MTTTFIGLGSNLGQRQIALRAALARIAQFPRTQILVVAPFRQTVPVDCPPNTPPFLNSVARIETALNVNELLKLLAETESELGRRRTNGRHEPRPIDLDILLFGDLVLERPELVVPHPRMHLRRFVLEPLAEIAPDVRHPVLGKTARELLADLPPVTERIAG